MKKYIQIIHKNIWGDKFFLFPLESFRKIIYDEAPSYVELNFEGEKIEGYMNVDFADFRSFLFNENEIYRFLIYSQEAMDRVMEESEKEE